MDPTSLGGISSGEFGFNVSSKRRWLGETRGISGLAEWCILSRFLFSSSSLEIMSPCSAGWTSVYDFNKSSSKETLLQSVFGCREVEKLDINPSLGLRLVSACATFSLLATPSGFDVATGEESCPLGPCTHYIRGVNNAQQPWHSLEGRQQYRLNPANPTEEGLASLHSVLFRKQPFLWRAALLYYTVSQARHMSFCELFQDLGHFVQDAQVRWEYCVRAKRGQADTSLPGCFSKDQVYLEGILQILRHRQTIDFQSLMALGKVSYEDVNRLKKHGVLNKARIPHFMQDVDRYMQQLNRIVTTNCLNDEELNQLLPSQECLYP